MSLLNHPGWHALGITFLTVLPPRGNASEAHVFLLAGQSNMAGRGETVSVNSAPDRILCYTDGSGTGRVVRADDVCQLEAAKDPLRHDSPVAGAGPGIPFANALLPKLGKDAKIVLVNRAWGGTTSGKWRTAVTYSQAYGPGNYPKEWRNSEHKNLFHVAIADFAAAMKTVADAGDTPRVGGILWFQGESDAEIASGKIAYNQGGYKDAEFRAHTREVLTGLRGELAKLSARDAGMPPVVIIEIPQGIGCTPSVRSAAEQIRASQSYMAVELGATFITSAGLPLKADKLHLDSDAQRLLGQRIAEALAPKGIPDSPGTPPRLMAALGFGGALLIVAFATSRFLKRRKRGTQDSPPPAEGTGSSLPPPPGT